MNDGARRPSVDAISSQLGPDELLIEFVSYERSSEDGSPGRRYGAFVLDRGGKLEWSDVGPAAPIDSSVRDLLTAANDWSVSVLNREGQAVRSSARTARDALADLSKRVWTPLRPLLEAEPNARRLRIAPDALLNLVPFEALSDGRDLIERFAITYLPAGRDLSVEGSGHRVSSAPVVLVSPGVDTSRDHVHDTAASAVRTRGLAHLAAAAEEAADFRRLVPRAELYAAANATESRLKGLHGPALLHIVGHGVIRGDDDCEGPTCISAGIDPAARAMALSAIVLEEAYGRGKGIVRRRLSDGSRTAERRPARHRDAGALAVPDGEWPRLGGRRRVRHAPRRCHRRCQKLCRAALECRGRRPAHADDALLHGVGRGADSGRRASSAKLQLRRSPATSSFLYWAPVILSGSASALPASLFHPAVPRLATSSIHNFSLQLTKRLTRSPLEAT